MSLYRVIAVNDIQKAVRQLTESFTRVILVACKFEDTIVRFAAVSRLKLIRYITTLI